MHFSIIFSLVLSLSIGVSAVPTLVARGQHNCNAAGGKEVATALGATYFITNKAKNTIVVSSIDADGTLSFAKEVATGGAGGSASGSADALFAQDSVVQSGGVYTFRDAG
jgi:hypothetical protein